MKLIHCADLHLDSNLGTNLTKDHAKERRDELLLTFHRLVRYALDHNVRAILIAGDLFDKNTISVTARKTVTELIRSNSAIDFYYLIGNHDASSLFTYMVDVPDNLKLFGKTWTQYVLAEGARGNIIITGTDFELDSASLMGSKLMLNPLDFNIVMLHGQVSGYALKGKGEIIDLKQYQNKDIDYLALGHIHTFQEGKLPQRGVYCYPGCLEGRGFDEYGEKGFVLLDIQEDDFRFTRQFVPFASRTIFKTEVDISKCKASFEVIDRIEKEIHGIAKATDLVKVVLTGEVDISCEIDEDLVRRHFEPSYYVFSIENRSRVTVDYSSYRFDSTLKGEFVRLVEENTELQEDEKADIIRCGLRALSGEEVS